MARKQQMSTDSSIPQSISLFCPVLKCGGTVDIVKCLYRCPKSRIIKCPEYTRVYPQLVNFTIDEKYIIKYGAVCIPVPLQLRKRRKRRVPVVE